jgi:hypothetical protein
MSASPGSPHETQSGVRHRAILSMASTARPVGRWSPRVRTSAGAVND